MKKPSNSLSEDFQIFDIHVHYGEYKRQFFSPETIDTALRSGGIRRYTTMLFPNTLHPVIDKDIWLNTKMSEQNSDVDLVLVLSPAMLQEDENLACFDRLPFRMIKLHGFLHNWHPNGNLIKSVFRFADKLKAPIMLHTGGCERSNAGNYLNICSQFPSVRVILAHSRPFDQTIDVMLKCPNVWADTSFVPHLKVRQFEKKGLIDRVIFGTDFPASAIFAEEPDLKRWYTRNLTKLVSVIGMGLFSKISNENYLNFYGQLAYY